MWDVVVASEIKRIKTGCVRVQGLGYTPSDVPRRLQYAGLLRSYPRPWPCLGGIVVFEVLDLMGKA